MKRIAVLGLHHDHVWSNLHELRETGYAEIVGAADPDLELQARFRSEFSGEAFSSYEALLSQEKLDAAYVFADNRLSEDLTVMACERGLHCLVEKPMASTLAGAERMKAAAEKAGVRLMINWPFAWWPALNQGVAMALRGDMGKIWQVKYRAAHEGPVELGCSKQFCEWLYDRERNGAGALMDYCGYGAVLASVLLGRPRAVVGACISTGLKPDLELEDNATLVMNYGNALAISEASWTQIGTMGSYETTIYGSEGTLFAEPYASGRLLLADRDHPAGRPVELDGQAGHLTNAANHFLTAIHDPDFSLHPLCDAGHALNAQWILEEGINS